MEYASDGDLFQKITHYKKDNLAFSEKQIWKIAIESIYALKSLHDLNVMHRDIKAANIMMSTDVDGNPIAKLGDLNVSKVCTKDGFNYT